MLRAEAGHGYAQPLLFGTKAETLERLRPLLKSAAIAESIYFTVKEWQSSPARLLAQIQTKFHCLLPDAGPLIVRSSAFNEDASESSMAGKYTSILNVNGADSSALNAAIERVIDTYPGNEMDQVLVQPMLTGVQMSGVIMTHDLNSGAPYYIINYDDLSGRTDSITGGTGVHKALVIHHNYDHSNVESTRIQEILRLTHELEKLCGPQVALDIEFAATVAGLYLLQLRRITVSKHWNRTTRSRTSEAIVHLKGFVEQRGQPRPDIWGSRTILGQMPDWNPAEIIGTHPRPLSTSLYRDLITHSTWSKARASMGYRDIVCEELMVILAGRPFIDVRNSFNSFLPEGLPDSVGSRIIDAWLTRLDEHPEYHDKVEFQVAQTIVDFSFDSTWRQRYDGVLSENELELYKHQLTRLTRRNLDITPGGSLVQAINLIGRLEALQQERLAGTDQLSCSIGTIQRRLAECREMGTYAFAIIARHAFIAESFLRSALERQLLSQERIDEFKRSLKTITSQLTVDFNAVKHGRLTTQEFFSTYGHLRPNTYDILSLRYDQRHDLFRDHRNTVVHDHPSFSLSADESKGLELALLEMRLSHISAQALMHYASVAITQREYAKFIFTRHLSNIIELISMWGEGIGLSRDDLSYLSLEDIFGTSINPVLTDLETHLKDIAEMRERSTALQRNVRLGYILRSPKDLYVIPLHRSAPNFITQRAVEADIIIIDGRMDSVGDVFSKIVCIENADPGFDWLFVRGIAGLITKFGGSNSHMAIRCAELGIPAAIGVGEQMYEHLTESNRVTLNCSERVVRASYEHV